MEETKYLGLIKKEEGNKKYHLYELQHGIFDVNYKSIGIYTSLDEVARNIRDIRGSDNKIEMIHNSDYTVNMNKNFLFS